MREELVEEAFFELIKEGIEPSVRRVRAKVGSGSMGDITPVVARLKAEREGAATELASLPEAAREKVDRLVLQLWSVLKSEAEAIASRARTESSARLAAVASEIQEASDAADRMEAELRDRQAECARLSDQLRQVEETKLAVEMDAAVSKQKAADLAERIDGLQALLAKSVAGNSPGAGVPPSHSPSRLLPVIRKAISEHGPFPKSELTKLAPHLSKVSRKRLEAALKLLVDSGHLSLREGVLGDAERTGNSGG